MITNTRAPQNWNTALLYAVERGDLDECKAAIAAGANPNQQDFFGETPLHYACKRGYTEIAKFLIKECKVDPNQRDYSKQTALHFTCLNGHTETAEFLIKDCKVDPNQFDNDNLTPLHLACKGGYTETAKFLIKECKVDPNQFDKIDETPLHLTCEKGHTETAILLIEHGALVNAVNNSNQTPLHLTCFFGYTETAILLIEHGATSDVMGDISETIPQHYIAAQQWCKNAFKETPEYGSLYVLSEEAKNVIKTIVANRFIDSAEEIDRFFTSHSSCDMLQTARDDITEITLNGNADEVTKAPDLDGMNLSGGHHEVHPHGDV